MNFNKHSHLSGQHAFLSGSRFHWIRYDEAKLYAAYTNYLAVYRGTKYHELAKQLIELNVKLPKSQHPLNLYVNDAIGFRMFPEQVLFYSMNAFGTADTISFRDNLLRIHDLKTGVSKVYMHQLEVYAALFCLEYSHAPNKIDMELRIYKSDNILVYNPEPEVIRMIMDKIIVFDTIIEKIRSEEDSWQS